MRILGIDPGSVITGFGVISINKQPDYISSGCIKMGKLPLLERLKMLYEDLSLVVKNYKPDVAAIEKVFVNKNVDSALKLGHARGVAMLVVANYNLTIAEYSPREIKKAIVGYGNADKNQVQQMITALLKLNSVPAVDAADALAVAICHGQFKDLKSGVLK